jgi:hypothetical protein
MKAVLTLEDHDDKVRITLELDPPLETTTESTPALGLASHLVKVIQEMLGNQDTNPTN